MAAQEHSIEKASDSSSGNGFDMGQDNLQQEYPVIKLTPDAPKKNRKQVDPSLTPQARAYRVAVDEDAIFRGTRTPDDYISADSMELHADHVTIDNETQVQVGILDDFPKEAEVGWWESIYERAGITTFVDIQPQNSDAIIAMLMKREGAIDTQLNDRKIKQLVDHPTLKKQKEEVSKLKDAIAEGTERVFSSEVLVRMEAEGEEKEGTGALKEVRRGVDTILKSLHTKLRIPFFRQDLAYRTATLTRFDGLAERRNVHTSFLATMNPGSRRRIQMENGVVIGFTVGEGDQSSPVSFDPMDLEMFNGNGGYFATSGAGKSSSLKVWAMRFSAAGTQVIIFQPERRARGEYRLACQFAEGFHFDMAPGTRGRINVLEMAPFNPDDEDCLDPFAEQMEYLPDTLRHMIQERTESSNAPKSYTGDEEQIVRRALFRLYVDEFGFDPEKPEEYQYMPSPKLPDLKKVFVDMANDGDEVLEHDNPHNAEEFKKIAGRYAGQLDKYIESAVGRIFSEDTNLDMDRPMIVFDMGGLPDSFRQQAYVITGRAVWNYIRRNPSKEKIVAADEIQVALGDQPDDTETKVSRELFTSMAEQSRKNNCMFWLATQRIGNLTAHEAGQRILNNLSWRFILGQTPQGLKELLGFFKFSKPELDIISAGTKNKGVGVFRVGNGEQGGTSVIMEVRRDPVERYITSTTRREGLKLEDLALPAEKDMEPSAETLIAIVD